jgi:capsid protein
MLAGLKRFFGYGPVVPAKPTRAQAVAMQQIKARYDNAQLTDENRRQWWMADVLSAKAANSFQVRRQLRMRSRYEVANNPYLFGIANSNADDLIDAGPTLQVTTGKNSFNRQIEQAWSDWCAAVGLVEKLRTAKLAKTVDGEGFLAFKTVKDLEHPVKLYPMDIEADQVTTPAPKDLGQLWVDGLTLHPVTGRPVKFHVLKHHPGDFFFPDFNPLAVEEVPARFIVHWFRKFRPGQVRGIPEFTAALDLFGELRSFRKSVLTHARAAAQHTAVIKNTGAPWSTEAGDTPEPWDPIPIDNGTMCVLPDQAELQAFPNVQPGTTYEMFQEKCLGEACRPIAYPLNLALGTSQKFNFSSARLDHINYRQSLRIERGDCETVVLEAIFRAWLEEAALVPHLLPAGVTYATTPHEWHWPGFPLLDVQSETQADLAQLAGGTQTWREFWATRGRDWREVMKQLADEKAEIEKLGLRFGEPVKKSVTVRDELTDGDSSEAAEVANA